MKFKKNLNYYYDKLPAKIDPYIDYFLTEIMYLCEI